MAKKISVWIVLAWLFAACGIISFLLAWYGVMKNDLVFGINPVVFFFDSITSGVFALFFLVYYSITKKK